VAVVTSSGLAGAANVAVGKMSDEVWATEGSGIEAVGAKRSIVDEESLISGRLRMY